MCYSSISLFIYKGYSMQFRKQKTLVQVLRYDGYKKDTKQPIMAMVGTIDLATFRFEKRDEIKLTSVEMLEINQCIEREQLIKVTEKAADSALKAFEGLRELNPNTDLSGLVHNNPDAIWQGLSIIEKALKAAGHERPKKIYIKKIPDTKTGDLLGQ